MAGTVSYHSDDDVQAARLIILCGMTSFVVLPILFGIMYAKYLTFQLSRAEAKDNKPKIISDSNVGEMVSTKAAVGQTRLSDMKMNVILRLWWKRQERLYGLSLDHDVEVSRQDDDDDEPAVKDAKQKTAKEKKPKKEKKHSSSAGEDDVDKEAQHAAGDDGVDKKPKKVKKHASSAGEDDVDKKPKKIKKHASSGEDVDRKPKKNSTISAAEEESRPKKVKKHVSVD